jgi:ABC-type transport system substrate-binding protein
MKKILTFLVVLALLLVPFASLAETVIGTAETPVDGETDLTEELPEEEEYPPLYYDYEELTVGNTMATTGAFFTSMWGNNTSDNDVRDLLHAYSLVEWNAEFGGFELDPSIVSGAVVTANEEGDHIYDIFLYDDLYYSDGSQITAWDYAFSYLLRMAPQIAELGGNPLQANYLVGYQDYITGNVPYLAGVRVVDDYQMFITISHEYLPFFFELALLDCNPYPISVLAPGSRVADDGNGVYFSTGLSTAQLQQTILDENTGYLTHPSVVSGPYTLTSYDGAVATFQRNPYYKGNAAGAVPLIERIIFKQANPETVIDELLNAELGLLNKATAADLVQNGMATFAQDPRFATANYQRSGLSFISFNTEKTAVSSQAVRQAIAYCLDKDGLMMDYVGNFGLRVDGYYGMGQWMFQLLNGTIPYPVEEPETNTAQAQQEYEEAVKAWDDLAQALEEMDKYEQDIDQAVAILEADGWTLNRQGGTFNPETDDVRCKNIDGALVALDLKLQYPAGNAIGGYLEERLVAPLAEAGIKLTLEGAEDLLSIYYSQGERDSDMLYLATNFDVIFDPTPYFEAGNPANRTRINDEELYQLAVNMRQTEAGDLLTYCEKWLQFQEHFNEVEPLIPVYSNVYFDFYTRSLHDYVISSNSTWSRAIVASYMGDYADEEEEEEADLDEGDMVFDD